MKREEIRAPTEDERMILQQSFRDALVLRSLELLQISHPVEILLRDSKELLPSRTGKGFSVESL
jgi:hypothetical protein